MGYEVLNLGDGRRVHRGLLRTDSEHLKSLREMATYITDIGFYVNGERTQYNERLAKRGELRLGIKMWRVNCFFKDKVNFCIDGLESMLSMLKDLGVKNPRLVEGAKGRKVVTFRDHLKEPIMASDIDAVWGVYVPHWCS